MPRSTAARRLAVPGQRRPWTVAPIVGVLAVAALAGLQPFRLPLAGTEPSLLSAVEPGASQDAAGGARRHARVGAVLAVAGSPMLNAFAGVGDGGEPYGGVAAGGEPYGSVAGGDGPSQRGARGGESYAGVAGGGESYGAVAGGDGPFPSASGGGEPYGSVAEGGVPY